LFIGNAVCCYSIAAPTPCIFFFKGHLPQNYWIIWTPGIPFPTPILIWLSYRLVT
jgi:hypothetical protein